MWKKKILGDICQFVRGPFGGSLKKSFFVKNGLAVYEQKNAIKNQCKDFRYFITQKKFKEMSRFAVNAGDILMSCSGTIGKTTIVPKGAPKGIINQALLKITPSDVLDVSFLKFYMESKIFIEQLMDTVDGAAIQNVASVKILKNITIYLPPLNEQKRIVAKLDSAFAEIDKIQKNYDKKKLEIDLLKNKFLLNKLSNVKSSKLFLLNEICNKITDGSHNPPKVSEGSTFMMLSSKNIFDDTINYDRPRLISEQSFHSENKRTDVKKNDVLLTIVGTIGRCAVVKSDDIKFTLQRSVAVFKPKNDLVDSRFLMYLLQSLIKDFNKRATGAAQQGIYLKQLKKTEVKIPTLDEQKKLVNDIDNFNNELEKLNKTIIKQKINYDFLKLSILSQKINKIAA